MAQMGLLEASPIAAPGTPEWFRWAPFGYESMFDPRGAYLLTTTADGITMIPESRVLARAVLGEHVVVVSNGRDFWVEEIGVGRKLKEASIIWINQHMEDDITVASLGGQPPLSFGRRDVNAEALQTVKDQLLPRMVFGCFEVPPEPSAHDIALMLVSDSDRLLLYYNSRLTYASADTPYP